ncbi:22988_t:CDS:2, partial [Cetraspora pellucida]
DQYEESDDNILTSTLEFASPLPLTNTTELKLLKDSVNLLDPVDNDLGEDDNIENEIYSDFKETNNEESDSKVECKNED